MSFPADPGPGQRGKPVGPASQALPTAPTPPQETAGATPWVPLTSRHRGTAVADLPTERFARLLTGLPDTGELEALYRADSTTERPPGPPGTRGTRGLGWLLVVGGAVGLLLSIARSAENSGLFDLLPRCGPGPVLGCEPAATTAWDPLIALVGVAGFAVTTAVGLALLSGATLPRRAWFGLQLAIIAGTGFTHILVLRNLYAIDAFCTYCLLAAALSIPMLTATTSHILRSEPLSTPSWPRTALSRVRGFVAEHPLVITAAWYAALGLLLLLGAGPDDAGAEAEAGAHGEESTPSLAAAGAAVALVSAATVAGAWTASRFADRMGLWLSIASAMMLVTALTDILPDVVHESEETGLPLWLPALALVGAFALVTVLTRGGHDHDHGHADGERLGAADTADTATGRHRLHDDATRSAMGGVGAAAALTMHRVVEGATLALTPSLAVIAALLVHSASEGLALGALLQQARKSLNTWLAFSVAGPVIGLAVATISPLPESAVPVLLALVGGVLLRTAMLGLQLALAKHRSGELLGWHIVAAVAAATGLAALTITTH